MPLCGGTRKRSDWLWLIVDGLLLRCEEHSWLFDGEKGKKSRREEEKEGWKKEKGKKKEVAGRKGKREARK